MKRIFMIFLSMVLAISLVACANSEAKELDGGANDIKIQIVSQDTQGDGEPVAYAVPDAGFMDVSTGLPEKFPVYINPYPYGEEGPLYDVTEPLKAAISDNLSRYLGLLYDDFSSQNVEFSSDPDMEHRVYYVRNTTNVGAFANGITVLSSDYGISDDASDAELLNNPLVKAAVSYLGLTDPVVTRTVECATDGTEYQRNYEITEKTDDVFQHILNRGFSCITVKKHVDSNNVLVQITDAASDGLVKYADYTALPYSSVLTALTSYYPNMDTTDVKAEIYYNATVQPGYFFPCYRFYIKDGVTTKSGGDLYTVVDVLLTDKSADD